MVVVHVGLGATSPTLPIPPTRGLDPNLSGHVFTGPDAVHGPLAPGRPKRFGTKTEAKRVGPATSPP